MDPTIEQDTCRRTVEGVDSGDPARALRRELAFQKNHLGRQRGIEHESGEVMQESKRSAHRFS